MGCCSMQTPNTSVQFACTVAIYCYSITKELEQSSRQTPQNWFYNGCKGSCARYRSHKDTKQVMLLVADKETTENNKASYLKGMQCFKACIALQISCKSPLKWNVSGLREGKMWPQKKRTKKRKINACTHSAQRCTSARRLDLAPSDVSGCCLDSSSESSS